MKGTNQTGNPYMDVHNALRPEETAIDRIEWLRLYGVQFDAGDAAILMDACDYRGQRLVNVAIDCAQTSGRSYWMNEQ